jgi:hypothetical protein
VQEEAPQEIEVEEASRSPQQPRRFEVITAKQLLPRGLRRAILPLTIALLWGMALPGAASAAPAPRLTVKSLASPSHFAPGDSSGFATYALTVINTGAAPTDGSPITITDELPAGVTVDPEPDNLFGSYTFLGDGLVFSRSDCTIGPIVTCTDSTRILRPGYALNVFLAVDIAPSASGTAINKVSVSGGGAPEASNTESTPITSEPVSPGYQALSTVINGDDGTPFTQAGGHPYTFSTSFQLNGANDPEANNPPTGTPKTVSAKLPKGMIVNPTASPVRCTEAQLEASEESNCPLGSVVGLFRPTISGFGFADPGITTEAIYNMVPPPGVAASLGFNVSGFGIFVHLFGNINSAGEFEITSKASDILQFGVLSGVTVELWGNPSDPSHDYRRGPCGYQTGAVFETACPTEPVSKAFLTMPTSCSHDALATQYSIETWEDRTHPIDGSAPVLDEEGNPLSVDGCNQLEFDPTITSQPTTNLADSPTGLDFNLHQPQNEETEGLATAALKDTTVTLPEGLVVNPSVANGLGACSESQIGYAPSEGKIHFTEAPQSCPDSAKLGSVEVKTTLLEETLPGSVYLAKPYENPFGSFMAIYLAIESPQRGVIAKLAGKVVPDPQTGRLTATFTENPELPLEDVSLHFFGGPRAALKTSLTCGAYTTNSTLVPWSTPEGETKHPTDTFATSVAAGGSGACPTSEAQAPNKPSFSAGTIAPQAGAYSPFVLKLTRQDGSQRIKQIDTTLPKGLTGKLAGIPYCSEAQIAQAKSREAPNQGAVEQQHPSCPAASEVGTVTVGAGAGITPYYATGHAYLAGPYEGAPLSLVIVTPAVAGPFDLGTVVVRTALQVDPETAQIHAVSDPIPQIIDGVPLDVRSIALTMDRPNFTLNPTSCDPMQVLGGATSTLGGVTSLSSPFQVGGCKALKFAPKLALSLKGGTTRGKHPALKAVLSYPSGAGYANTASAQVTLPHGEFIDQSHFKTICTRVQFAADQCPAGAVYGRARAITPLLDKPVEGPVYLRSSNHQLPDLVIALKGQVNANLVGRVDTGPSKGLRTTFETAPDVPVSKVILQMQGGKKGLLVNSENICRTEQLALAHFTAQNGKVYNWKPLVKNGCKTAAKARGHKKGKRH